MVLIELGPTDCFRNERRGVSVGEYRVGVDIGGTFTDVVTLDDDGVHVTKTPSTPDKPETGVVNGINRSREAADIDPTDISFLSHGTTVATNAVLEGTWAETALVTTAGFRDVLEIARQNRPALYDFGAEKPKPVVPRDRRFEIPERLDERGRERRPVDEERVVALAAEIEDAGAESVAVSLLFAFENDAHERTVRDGLRNAGLDLPCSLSSRVLPEIREYERTLTTALNAGLQPVLGSYLGALVADLDERGVPADLLVMQSNGGLMGADAARERPINTLLSGPAAGVRGAAFVAGRRGREDVITMDMGGTSCDLSLVADGDPLVSTDVTVGDYTMGVPMIDIHTVGSGGGSVAWVDGGDALRVGPRSAGAKPGPVSYGQGGERPTTTDAHLLAGRLDPEHFLPDDRDVSVADVEAAVERDLCDPLGMSVQEAAQGVLDVANATMARALRVVSVERGHDPREFALVAFGGAGPLHAPRLAAELDIPEVVVPRAAGALSALGLLVSDVVYDESRSRVRPWPAVDPADLDEVFADLEARGRERLRNAGINDTDRRFERTVDLRYRGQSSDLSVEVPDPLDADVLETIEDRFHDRHERRYGHSVPDEPVELVTVRSRAKGVVETPDLSAESVKTTVEDARRETRTVIFEDDEHETRVYDRSRLPADGSFEGPAVVEGAESTVVIQPGQSVTIDSDGSLVVDTGGGA